MKSNKRSFRGSLILAALSAFLIAAGSAQAQTITSIYSPVEGGDPYGTGSLAALTSDNSGNLYGTTFNGGLYQEGQIFEVSPNGSGGWTGTTIFTFNGTNGANPGYGPMLYKNGNLYGTTLSGGSYGYGTVFQLTPSAGGWTETILYSFNNQQYNQEPVNGLVMDPKGNLYGTTFNEILGKNYGGGVFELSPSGGGWTEQLIYAFPRGNLAGLAMDDSGNLYGIGSTGNSPTVFELSQDFEGSWIPKILYTFSPTMGDGSPGGAAVGPNGTLALSQEGNLIGANAGVGKYLESVFELIRPANPNSKWTIKVLHTFKGGTDGANPLAGVTLDGYGNIFGTTVYGGANNQGVVYELFNDYGGKYTESVLASVSQANGIYANGGVLLDSAGNLYGTTSFGGNYNLGIVYQLTP